MKELKDKKAQRKSAIKGESSSSVKSVIVKAIEADTREDEIGHEEFLTIRKAMEQFVGKQITARVQSKLPAGYTIKQDMSWFKVIGPSGKDHMLCYKQESYDFKLETFDDRDAPYNRGAKERMHKNKAILNSPEKLKKVVDHFSSVKKHFDALKELTDIKEMENYDLPASYDILRAINVDSRILSDIKYGRR